MLILVKKIIKITKGTEKRGMKSKKYTEYKNPGHQDKKMLSWEKRANQDDPPGNQVHLTTVILSLYFSHFECYIVEPILIYDLQIN